MINSTANRAIAILVNARRSWRFQVMTRISARFSGVRRCRSTPMAPQPALGTRGERELDPTGQNVTTFRLNGKSLPAEAVPYIVLPQNEPEDGPFDPNVAIGDVAIVIFKDMITAAICGDLGPVKKIGEASIRVHEALQPACPDPCRRDRNGFVQRFEF